MKIKRIICLLLAMVFMLALISCGDNKDPQEPESVLEPFIKMLESSNPKTIRSLTSVNTGDETLSGEYKTEIVSENEYIMNCSQQFYANPQDPDADPEQRIVTKTGVISYKDGKYSYDGGDWVAAVPDSIALQVKFSFAEDNLGEYELSTDGKTFTTTLTTEQASAVLGIKVDATDDAVYLTITTDGTYLRNISISYATQNAENISVDTSYSY